MKNVRMAGVAFFLLMMQLVCLSVKADNKADYLKSTPGSMGQYAC